MRTMEMAEITAEVEIKAEMESNGENRNNGGSGYNGGEDSLNGAAGEKVYATASASPKTGDNTNLLARWFALFAAALVLAVTARKLYRKEKDR